MAIRSLNEYRVTFAGDTPNDKGNEVIHVAETLTLAAEQNETLTRPLAQITRIRTGITVDVPEPINLVRFITKVTPFGAVDAKSLATPSVYTVPEGTEVIFEAIPGLGFDFAGWYKENVLISTDQIAKIAITLPPIDEDVSTYEARFVPVP